MSAWSAHNWKTGPLPSQTKKPRHWRTRPDPLDGVWEAEVVPLLERDEAGALEATTVLEELGRRHGERFGEQHLRTLPRRMRDWRRELNRRFKACSTTMPCTRRASSRANRTKTVSSRRPTIGSRSLSSGRCSCAAAETSRASRTIGLSSSKYARGSMPAAPSALPRNVQRSVRYRRTTRSTRWSCGGGAQFTLQRGPTRCRPGSLARSSRFDSVPMSSRSSIATGSRQPCRDCVGSSRAASTRHVIWSLVRKPSAFARYRYREELLPSLTFRRAYDALVDARGERASRRRSPLAAARNARSRTRREARTPLRPPAARLEATGKDLRRAR